MGRSWWRWIAGAAGAGMLLGWGATQIPAPEYATLTGFVTPAGAQQALAPAPTPLPPQDEIERLRAGLTSSDMEDWAGVRSARSLARDPLVRKMLTWRLACAQQSDASFEELKDALAQLVDWPCRDTIRRRAEQAILDSATPMPDRIAFLQSGGGPVSGDGKIALAQALSMTGKRTEAIALAREAWRTDALSSLSFQTGLQTFDGAFTEDDHAARVDAALWRDDRGGASQLMSRLSPSHRQLAAARIALQTRPRRGLQKAVDAVPGFLRDDPGFLYDRARFTRRVGAPERALPVAARINPLSAPAVAREALFQERRLYVARALKSGDYTTAYHLAADHGLTSGVAFADAEWLAGWIALRFTRDFAKADAHFARLVDKVGAPVSKSRALYWRAQAQKALGQTDAANGLLQQAAQFNFTYYGQLAATRLGTQPVLSLGDPPVITPEQRAAFNSNEIVRALRLIADIGDRQDFESIAYFLDDRLQSAQEHELLGQLARDKGYPRTAVRTAKAGLFRGIVAPGSAYPIISIPADAQRPGAPEPALIHAIIRQESEFEPTAVSHAGARGLMQLMPGTARGVCLREGISYQTSRLTDDPGFNVTIGAYYLQQMLDRWGGSYVLTIASYNAGPDNAQEWIDDWGDPRSPSVDVVDWIELIPFSETRNYVQRVLENVQVYRNRLAKTPAPILLDKDLKRGAY